MDVLTTNFWLFQKKNRFPEKIETDAGEAFDAYVEGYWNFVYYRLIEKPQLSMLKTQYLSTITGQGVFLCAKHNDPLTKDYPKSGYYCRCGKKSSLRCLQSRCSAAVCSKTFERRIGFT